MEREQRYSREAWAGNKVRLFWCIKSVQNAQFHFRDFNFNFSPSKAWQMPLHLQIRSLPLVDAVQDMLKCWNATRNYARSISVVTTEQEGPAAVSIQPAQSFAVGFFGVPEFPEFLEQVALLRFDLNCVPDFQLLTLDFAIREACYEGTGTEVVVVLLETGNRKEKTAQR
ncbi:hypothetical protein BT69DRAFT_1298473 [Atractiella rhizophila]|nr:hypothetical protein BT69DRAFT_1298473 [Atractiella rhizophila]